jgi:hypothetical protein
MEKENGLPPRISYRNVRIWLYTADAAKLDGISVLTVPFFPPPNRDIIRSNKALFGGGKKGAVKTEIPSNFAMECGARFNVPRMLVNYL